MTPQARFSRRHFIKTLAAVASGAPFFLPSRIWAAEVKPSNRLTLGFIGMGKQQRSLLGDFLRRTETQVVAICEVDRTRRENAKKAVENAYAKRADAGTFKSCDTYVDFRELLARKDIDAVVIATPDHWHALIAIAAANAGKDIYCEKPLCQSIHEARAMVTAVRRNRRVFQTGSMQRSSREFRTAVELVRNQRLGKITRAEVAVGGPPVPCDLPAEPAEPGLDWNLWLGPAPERPYNSTLSPRGVHDHYPAWRNYREYGGGGVTDWGAHHFDIVQWALDMDQSGPVEIQPAQTPNATHGVKLLYSTETEVVHIAGNGITFYGSEGKLAVNRGQFKLWLGSEQKADSVADLDAITAQYLAANARHVYHSDNHKSDWLQCIRTRNQPIADVEIGARTVTVCHLVNLAYRYGKRMRWNPQTERFADGTGDPAWLDVSYRAPWKLA